MAGTADCSYQPSAEGAQKMVSEMLDAVIAQAVQQAGADD